jgi:hypothetical protein
MPLLVCSNSPKSNIRYRAALALDAEHTTLSGKMAAAKNTLNAKMKVLVMTFLLVLSRRVFSIALVVGSNSTSILEEKLKERVRSIIRQTNRGYEGNGSPRIVRIDGSPSASWSDH